MSIRLVDSYVKPFVGENELAQMQVSVTAAHTVLSEKSGAGNAFLGWVDLPVNYDK